MTGAFGTSLHFAAHLLAFSVALGAAFVIAGDRDQRGVGRVAGMLAFLALAAGEAIHGADFAGEIDAATVSLRIAGYVLLLGYALAPRPRAELRAGLAFPGGAIPPAIVAFAAALATAWLRRDPRHRALAAGLALLGVAEVLLAARSDLAWGTNGYHWLRSGGYVLVALFVLLTTRRSIQFRIVAGFVSLLLVVVLGVSTAVAQILARNLRAEAIERVDAQARGVERQFEPLVGNKTSALLALGNTEGVAERLVRGQSFGPGETDRLRQLVVADVDFVLLLDRRGRILGRSGIGSGASLELIGSDVVSQALQTGLESASVDEFGPDGLALVGIAPVLQRGQPIGFAVAGFEVDESFLDAVDPAGSRVAVFRDGRRPLLVAELGFPGGATPLIRPGALGRIWRDVQATGATEERELRLRPGRHFVSFEPLDRPDGAVVGMLLVAEPAALLASTQRDVNRVIFLVTLGVVGLAFLSSLLAARRISRPVRALTRAAERVQAGDLQATAPVTGTDEVGTLGTAFNSMTASIAAMTDDLRAAAEEQAALRSRLETVVNSMTEGLIAVDGEGRIVTYNEEAGTITGRPQAEAVGGRLEDVLTVADADGEDRPFEGEIPESASFVRRQDGTLIPVAISSGPLQDPAGVLLGHVHVLRDMTREHEIERMKGEFLANISHELRTPLTPIIGYSEILQRKKIPHERAVEFAGGILKSAKRLERIVAMLVDFSAMEAGRMAIRAEPAPVEAIVQQTVQEWDERSSKHRFAVDVPDGLPKVEVDLPLLRRTLGELLDNAVKYSPDGGTIDVRVADQNSGPERMLRFEVADPGIGIEQEDLEGIFQDFRQVDASSTRTFGGLGLGLAFVKRIVEAHGGTIWAESTPGEGATFRFTLPASDNDR